MCHTILTTYVGVSYHTDGRGWQGKLFLVSLLSSLVTLDVRNIMRMMKLVLFFANNDKESRPLSRSSQKRIATIVLWFVWHIHRSNIYLDYLSNEYVPAHTRWARDWPLTSKSSRLSNDNPRLTVPIQVIIQFRYSVKPKRLGFD